MDRNLQIEYRPIDSVTPYARSLIGNVQPTLSGRILYIAKTQGKASIEPDRMANNTRWKTVTLEGNVLHPES